MGQKVNPICYRLVKNNDWKSIWYANKDDYSDYVVQDFLIREFIFNLKKSVDIGLSSVTISRSGKVLGVKIHSSKPGVLVGKNGADLNRIKNYIKNKFNLESTVSVVEVRKPELDAALVAQLIARQIERRVSYKKAMKKAISSSMKLGAKGIRINCAGRLQGAEIARNESYKEGRISLHTLRSNIDYSTAKSFTSYGVIGIKVWIYKGDIS